MLCVPSWAGCGSATGCSSPSVASVMAPLASILECGLARGKRHEGTQGEPARLLDERGESLMGGRRACEPAGDLDVDVRPPSLPDGFSPGIILRGRPSGLNPEEVIGLELARLMHRSQINCVASRSGMGVGRQYQGPPLVGKLQPGNVQGAQRDGRGSFFSSPSSRVKVRD